MWGSMLDCLHMLLPNLVTTLPDLAMLVCPSLLPITAAHHYCPLLPPPTAPPPLRRPLHHCSCGAALPRCVTAVTAVAGGAARRTQLHNRGGEGACGRRVACSQHALTLCVPPADCGASVQLVQRAHHLLALCRCALLLCCLHRRIHRLRHLASISSS